MSSNSHPRTRCSAGRRAGSWDAGARPAAAACVKGICNVGTTRDTRTCSGSSDLPIRGGRGNNRTSSAGFWVAATDLRAVADLAEAGGWEAEYPRDVWRMRRLGYDGDRTLRFAAIPQPWLRDLTKRWVRWRLSTGLCRATGGGRPVVVITRFAGFLADIGVERIDQIDRSVLKRYLADLRGDSVGTQWRSAHLGLLNRLLAPSANTVGTQPFRPTRCSAPRTTRNAPNGCRGRWPNMSWPSSSTRTTSPASTTRPSKILRKILRIFGSKRI